MKELDGKKIKSVNLVFENDEIIQIPIEGPMYFYIPEKAIVPPFYNDVYLIDDMSTYVFWDESNSHDFLHSSAGSRALVFDESGYHNFYNTTEPKNIGDGVQLKEGIEGLSLFRRTIEIALNDKKMLLDKDKSKQKN